MDGRRGQSALQATAPGFKSLIGHFAFDLHSHFHLGRDFTALSIVSIAEIPFGPPSSPIAPSDGSCLFAQMHECTICVDNRDRPFPSAVIEDRGRFRLVRYSSIHSKAVHDMSRAMLLTERPASLLLARMYAAQTG